MPILLILIVMTTCVQHRSASTPMDIPLVASMMEDPRVRVVPRAIDNNWVYASVCSGPISGFNPTRGEVYCATESSFGGWLRAPQTPARELNVADRLIREALFAAHDYLHAWAALEIAALAPEVGFGHAPITASNFEDHVFCQLATEAVATVGLDYWYLATLDLEQELNVGTCVRTLTTSYHEDYRDEYRRYCPALEVQSPDFFTLMARFYCSGVLPGFRDEALRHSPRVLAWLRHELSYGSLQRRYTRQWLSYLAGPSYGHSLDRQGLEAPVSADAPWQVGLVEKLAQRLWAKVHGQRIHDDDDVVVPLGRAHWSAPAEGPLDFRFTNLNALGDDLWDAIEARGVVPDSFPSFFAQFLCGHEYAAVPPALVAALPSLLPLRSSVLLRHALSSFPRIRVEHDEPHNVFVLN